jgi:hypothetical protein
MRLNADARRLHIFAFFAEGFPTSTDHSRHSRKMPPNAHFAFSSLRLRLALSHPSSFRLHPFRRLRPHATCPRQKNPARIFFSSSSPRFSAASPLLAEPLAGPTFGLHASNANHTSASTCQLCRPQNRFDFRNICVIIIYRGDKHRL